MRYICLFCIFFCVTCTSGPPAPSAVVPESLPWEAIETQARHTTVKMMMWQGDPLINRYMSEWVKPELERRYGITLNIAPGQGTEIVKLLLGERDAGHSSSSIDMCWINGETFFQLRQIQALYGPFVQRLPNAQFIDLQNPFIGKDFQQPADGYECPWGNVQQCFIYDTLRTPRPPLTLEALEEYVRAHPGKFTLPYHFTGMTVLKSWLMAIGKDSLHGPFDSTKYQRYSSLLWDYINRNKKYFWRKGETFPENLALVHQMFANGELDFTMSNNDNEVDNKIIQGIFPGSSKGYVMSSGSIQNSHYLGIPTGAVNKAGALTVINFMISPEAQWEKLRPSVWGDGSVLAPDRLPPEWAARFRELPGRKNAPRRADIQRYALQEPAPEYMIRLYEDFRKFVIEQ